MNATSDLVERLMRDLSATGEPGADTWTRLEAWKKNTTAAKSERASAVFADNCSGCAEPISSS